MCEGTAGWPEEDAGGLEDDVEYDEDVCGQTAAIKLSSTSCYRVA